MNEESQYTVAEFGVGSSPYFHFMELLNTNNVNFNIENRTEYSGDGGGSMDIAIFMVDQGQLEISKRLKHQVLKESSGGPPTYWKHIRIWFYIFCLAILSIFIMCYFNVK